MSARAIKFGLTLPNRGVIIGATTVAEMIEMAEWADSASRRNSNSRYRRPQNALKH